MGVTQLVEERVEVPEYRVLFHKDAASVQGMGWECRVHGDRASYGTSPSPSIDTPRVGCNFDRTRLGRKI